jgi:hypothetical protein
VLHYLADWVGPLTEFHRVLAPHGAVVFSTHHPAMDWQLHSPEDYFAVPPGGSLTIRDHQSRDSL